MTSLGKEAKKIVEAGRAVDGPTPADRARIRRAVFSQAGIGVAAVAAQAVATSQAAASGIGAGAGALGGAAASANVLAGGAVLAGAKVVMAVVAIGAVGVGAGYWRYGVTSPERRVAPSAAAPSAPAQPPNPPRMERATVRAQGNLPNSPLPPNGTSTAVSAPTAPPRAGPYRAPLDGMPAALTPVGRASVSGVPVASSPSEPPARPSSVVEETALLRAANDALRSADSSSALMWLERYVRRYPHGLLGEEYAAAHAVALCAAGRLDEGIAEAETFVKDYPRSPLQGRVRSSCSTGP